MCWGPWERWEVGKKAGGILGGGASFPKGWGTSEEESLRLERPEKASVP